MTTFLSRQARRTTGGDDDRQSDAAVRKQEEDARIRLTGLTPAGKGFENRYISCRREGYQLRNYESANASG